MSDDDQLSLQEAADVLGVHYMTAYRHVRLGKIPAVKVGGEWRVRRGDLSRTGREGAARGDRRTDYTEELIRTMVAADEGAAWLVTENALASGMDPLDFYLDVLASALTQIGDAWEAGEISVAEEHQASAVATRLIGRLGPRFNRRGRTKGTVVLGAPPEDLHSIPTAIMADVLKANGFGAIDLGARVPPESFAAVASSSDRLIAVGIAATAADGLARIPETVAALRAVVDVPILMGGSAIRDEAQARELGADAFGADAQSGVLLIEELISSQAG
jgi:excisionase family DNA binding protein